MTLASLTLLAAVVGAAPADPLSLKGPGGTVKIGDTLAVAKRAFPAPKKATVFEHSMNFTSWYPTGWAWSVEEEKYGFEAATVKGKIVAFAVTDFRPSTANREALEIKTYGNPTKKGATEKVGMLAWVKGDNARVLVNFRKDNNMLGKGSLLTIGNKAKLATIFYDADNPQRCAEHFSKL